MNPSRLCKFLRLEGHFGFQGFHRFILENDCDLEMMGEFKPKELLTRQDLFGIQDDLEMDGVSNPPFPGLKLIPYGSGLAQVPEPLCTGDNVADSSKYNVFGAAIPFVFNCTSKRVLVGRVGKREYRVKKNISFV